MRHASLFFAAVLVACSGKTETESTPSTDANVDVVDAPADTTTIDSFAPDVTLADATDSAVDAPSDVVVPETGATLTAQCSAAGGVLCTSFRWNICPKGFEPVSSTDHYGCGTADGWCCRPAPPSACASSGIGNCLPTCPIDCWQPVTDTSLTCDGTRKCCRDVCK